MSVHADHRFSITISSDDLAVVNCLRALADYSQQEGNKRIAWGGTKDSDWKRAGNSVTFRFTSAAFRTGFEENITRLLPVSAFKIIGQSDSDPATPQAR